MLIVPTVDTGDQHFSIQHDRNIQAEKRWIQIVKIIITSNAWILLASERTLNMERKEKNRTAVEHAVHVQQRECKTNYIQLCPNTFYWLQITLKTLHKIGAQLSFSTTPCSHFK